MSYPQNMGWKFHSWKTPTMLGTAFALLYAGSGWLLHWAAAWLFFHHEELYYRLYETSFRFICEQVDALLLFGPTVCTFAGLFLGLPLITATWCQSKRQRRIVLVNMIVAFIFTTGIVWIKAAFFALLLPAGTLLWLWALAISTFNQGDNGIQPSAPVNKASSPSL